LTHLIFNALISKLLINFIELKLSFLKNITIKKNKNKKYLDKETKNAKEKK